MADFKSHLPVYIGDLDSGLDLSLAQDGVAEVGVGVEVYGSDGTNNRLLSTDTSGQLNVNVVSGGGTNTQDTDDDSIAAGQTLDTGIALGYGYDGTAWERLTTDGSGSLDVNVTLALPAGTNNIGDIGTIVDLEATDGAAALTKGIHFLGTDGTNAQIISTDTGGQIQLAHDANTNPLFTEITDGTNELSISVEGAALPANGLAVHAEDGSGNAAPLKVNGSGALLVSTDAATGQVLVDHASVNLVKDTPTTVNSYSPAAATDRIVRVSVSGSGRFKAELFWGTTSSEVLSDVKFGTSSMPNVEFDLEKDLELASTETIYVRMTNLEKAASPTSDFDGFVSIYYVD